MIQRIITLINGLVAWIVELQTAPNPLNDPALIAAVEAGEAKLAERAAE